MTDQQRQAAPDITREQELWTYQDVVEHLMDVFDVDRSVQSRQLRNARRAADEAIRELPNYHEWKYYLRPMRVTTSASYSTGTITYDHTGGSSERLLTLASGTWPTWAAQGSVKISNVDYEVEKYIDTTNITLRYESNPGSDVAAGTSYEIVRNRYTLPVDYRRSGRVFAIDDNYGMAYVSGDYLHTHGRVYADTPGTPWTHAIVEEPYYHGALAIELSPAPSAAVTYGFLYERAARPFRTELYRDGYATVNGDPTPATAISGTNTTWTADHKGAVLRLSATKKSPTSKIGYSNGVDNPYAYQRIITDRTDATNITVDQTIAEDLSAVAYTISDPVDVEVGSMFNAYLRLCEAKFADLARRKDADKRMAKFRRQLLLAMDADRRNTAPRSSVIWGEEWLINVGEVSPIG